MIRPERLVAEALLSLRGSDAKLFAWVTEGHPRGDRALSPSHNANVTIWSRALDKRTVVVILQLEREEVTPNEEDEGLFR